jgi:predicted kinase
LGPTLIFLIGAAASGKSTIGKIVAAEYNFCYLDKDIICNHFTGLLLESKGYSPNERDGCPFYGDVIMSIEYKTLLNIANDNLKLGKSVLLDAPFIGFFSNPHYIDELRKSYDWQDVTILVLQVSIDFDVLKKRMMARANERDKWKFDHWEAYVKSIQEKQCQWKNVEIRKFDNSDSSIDISSLHHTLQLHP